MFRVTHTIPLFACLLVVLLLSSAPAPTPALAQGEPTPEAVSIEASDGLMLAGNFFFAPDAADAAPGVLLMHHGGGQKESWFPLVPALYDAGYAVLAIDMRGTGESGQSEDWDLAVDDTQRWLDWLGNVEGVDADHLSIIGASLGGDLAINVMEIDERIQTLIWISPLLEVEGITTDDAMAAVGEQGRPVFIMTAAGDIPSLEATHALFPLMSGNSQVRLYDNTGCCTFMFMLEPSAEDEALNWLELYG
jgi:pimeloyl-ACP methyl ester carboxylesterase